MEVSVGIKVAARGLEWDVTEVESLGPQQRVRLACSGGDLAGLEWDVLYPAEPLSVLQTEPRPDEAGSLEDWRRYHIARLLEQIPGEPVPPGRVAIEAYQRVPLLRALDMVRPRLLLADGVGLGKTVQAGLIAAELLVRRRAHRILIVCPPGPLLRQWEQEMRYRFGLRFTLIADSASLREARRGLELGGNPFDATALCLTSMDFAKQDRVLAELERASWDLVIIDEAHHCVGEQNQRRVLAEVLSAKSDGLLLLTATPHDGYDPHFASLMVLLDPSLVDHEGRLIGNAYRRHVIRRLKSHIRTPSGAPLFRERIVVPVRVDVTGTEPVQAFHKALSALVMPRLQRCRDKTGLTDALAFVSLLKRSMSTIAACLATLRVVADRYGTEPAKERQRALRAYRRKMARFGVLATDEEAEIAELEAEEMAANLDGTADDLDELIRLGGIAEAHDPKLAALVLEIRLIRLHHPNANVLVYTEYADSQRAAVAALEGIGGSVLTISGADSEADRTRATERCAEEDGIVLVSTDSLAEGLNLHQRCFHLIHLDLPYNPNRLEQRNGRIDRYGQRNDPEIRYLFLAGTFEERLLLRLIAKYEKARSCLSFMPNTLGVSAHPASLHEPLFGFAEDLFSSLPRLVHSLDLAAEDTDSDAYRDLLREIDRAFQSFDHMAVRHGWLSGGEGLGTPTPQSRSDIDLGAFVRSVLTPDGDSYRVPPAWARELDGLPGFDPARGVVRLTDDPNSQGGCTTYPGRSHPLVQRAIASVRTGRVSAIQGHAVSLLMTYAVEAGSLFRSVFALRLFPDGSIQEQDVATWLSGEPASTDELWRHTFASWAPDAMEASRRHAASLAEKIGEEASGLYHDRVARRDVAVRAWLTRRATELCGPVQRWAGDLFDPEPPAHDWRHGLEPQQRLADFAADPEVPVSRRREAADALARFKDTPAPFPRPVLRTLGLLMLIP
jgi:superfamily II DNA or RNA helicase